MFFVKEDSLNLNTHTVLHKHVYEFKLLYPNWFENKILNYFLLIWIFSLILKCDTWTQIVNIYKRDTIKYLEIFQIQ